MIILKLATNGLDLIKLETNLVTSDNKKSVSLEVTFDDSWTGYGKSATFKSSSSDKIYEVPLADNACVVPWEVLESVGTMSVGVRGVKDDGSVIASDLVDYKIAQGAKTGDGTSEDPTPTVYQQILSNYNHLDQIIKDEQQVTSVLSDQVSKNSASIVSQNESIVNQQKSIDSLGERITGTTPESYGVVDAGLTMSGQAGDAKVIGDKFQNSNIVDIQTRTLIAENVPFIHYETIEGGFINTSGAWTDDSTQHYKKTNVIACKPGQTFLYKGYAKYSVASAIFYDMSGKRIGNPQYESADVYTEVTIPNNCYSVMFGSYASTGKKIILEVKRGNDIELKDVYNSNILWGKKYTACGDSYTYGNLDCIGRTYSDLIAKRNNMNYLNLAKNGTAMSDFMSIYKNIPTDSDYITIAYGLNDYSRKEEIGTLSDTSDDKTFMGYWNTALDYLTSHSLYAHIGIIIMPSYMGDSYRTAMEQIATKWGVPYLNLYTDTKVPMFMYKKGADSEIQSARYKRFEERAGNNHPSPMAHEYISTSVEQFIRTI